MFDIDSIDTSTFSKYGEHIYLNNDISEEDKIFRYTSFSNLLTLLESKRFYIGSRENFSDRREKGEFYNSKLCFYRFNPANEKVPEKVLNEWSYKDAQIKEACKLPTSCWTTQKQEDFLMWKAYAGNESGVRIETSIKELMIALQNHPNKIFFLGRMKYGKEKPWYEVVDSMFYKTEYYHGESEFRFYVVEKKEDKFSKSISLEITSPESLIKNIILSPFLHKKVAETQMKILQERYAFLANNVKISEIMEYKK